MEETEKPEADKAEESAETVEETQEEASDDASPIEQANQRIAEMKKLNAEKKKLLDREEKIMAERKLMGRGLMTAPAKPEEEISNQDYAAKAMEGVVHGKKE